MAYTIVQHSNYGYAENSIFQKKLEIRQIRDVSQIAEIKAIGGVVFDDIESADKFIINHVVFDKDTRDYIITKGFFSQKTIDGLKIYVPKEQEPKEKSEGVDSLLNRLTGRSRKKSIKTATCAVCGGEATSFKDELSLREFRISGLCQKCQDRVFGG